MGREPKEKKKGQSGVGEGSSVKDKKINSKDQSEMRYDNWALLINFLQTSL